MLKFFKRNKKENIEQIQEAVKPSRDRWFGRILNVLRSSKLDDALWDELEEILISSDVGVDTSLRIIEELKAIVKEKKLESGDEVFESLKESLAAGMEHENSESLWLDDTEITGPYVILMVGVNGVGKTTSIAKLAHHFTQEGKKVLLGAGDTFRAAAAEQLEILGKSIGVDVISHEAGGDPGAVAQAKSFKEAVDCTGIFLAKLDGTARGGIVLAIKQELQVPILFIGTGEGVTDFAPFDTREFVESLLAPV